jgi:hypothetical protein
MAVSAPRACQSLGTQSNITWPGTSSSQTRNAIEFQTRQVCLRELKKPT